MMCPPGAGAVWEKGLSLHLLALYPGSSCRHPHLCLPASLAFLGGGRCGPVSLSPFWGSVSLRLPSLVPQKEPRPGFTKARGPCPRVGAGGPGLPLMLSLLSPTCPLSCLRPCARAGPQRPSCSCVLCTVLLSLAVLLAVAATSAVLLVNHARAPGTAPPPVVSTGPAGANSALVTVDRADSSRLSILIDPRCPDLTDGFARLEGAQASVLQALSQRQAEPRLPGEQEQELLDTLADQLPRLLARASELQAECSGLRKGHGALGQGLSALQSEQGRLIQVRVGGLCLPQDLGRGGWGGCHHLLALLSACCPRRHSVPGPGAVVIPVCGQADEAQRGGSLTPGHTARAAILVTWVLVWSPWQAVVHPSVKSIHRVKSRPGGASQAHLCQWTQETQDVASIRLIEVQGHVVLSGKHPHPRLCHVVRESRTPSARSPHPLPFDAHSLPGKGGAN